MALNGENGQNLTRLAIEDNGISDVGADALWQACAAEKLPQLTELFMSRNNIGDTGIFAALASSIAQGGFAKLGALDLNSIVWATAASERLARRPRIWVRCGASISTATASATQVWPTGAMRSSPPHNQALVRCPPCTNCG